MVYYNRATSSAFLFLLTLCLFACSPNVGAAGSGSVSLDELAEVSPNIRNARESVRISKDPSVLNNATFKDLYLNKLMIKNARLTGGTFNDCGFNEMVAENVTFENFTFEKAIFYKSTFTNVKFLNCTVSDSLILESEFRNSSFTKGSFVRKRYYGYGNRPDMDKVTFDVMTFDGPAFKGGYYIGNTTGSVVFKNVRDVEGSRHEGRYLFHGMTVNVTFENCAIGEMDYLQLWRDSKYTAKNCSFAGSVFWVGTGTTMEFDNCTFSDKASIETDGVMILRSCTVKDPMEFPGGRQPEKLQLINTTLPASR